MKATIDATGKTMLDDKPLSLVSTLKKFMPDLTVHDFKNLTPKDKIDLAQWLSEDIMTKNALVFQ